MKRGRNKPYNYLAAAEMGGEGNCNMVDGIVNNVPRPSLLDGLKAYGQRIADQNRADDERRNSEHTREEL